MTRPARARISITLIRVGGAILAALALATLVIASAVQAASPSPTAAAGGDPRSSGQGPGLVGDPLTALVVVVVIAVGSLAATLVYVRFTGGQGAGPTR